MPQYKKNQFDLNPATGVHLHTGRVLFCVPLVQVASPIALDSRVGAEEALSIAACFCAPQAVESVVEEKTKVFVGQLRQLYLALSFRSVVAHRNDVSYIGSKHV